MPTQRAINTTNRLRVMDTVHLLEGYRFFLKLCAEPGKRPQSPHFKMLAALREELEYRGTKLPVLSEGEPPPAQSG